MKKKIIIAISAFAVIGVIAAAVCLLGDPVNSDLDKINFSAGAPVSSAEITELGFTDSIPDTDAAPTPSTVKAVPGTTLVSYCKVDNLDIATSATVYWTLPDGTTTQKQNVAVNRNTYYYSEMAAEDSGEYTVTWEIYRHDAVTESVNVG